MKEPKVRVRPSVVMAADSPDKGDLLVVRVVMPARLDPGGFTAASPRRHPVSFLRIEIQSASPPAPTVQRYTLVIVPR